jgi:lipid A 3-O-deacylase
MFQRYLAAAILCVAAAVCAPASAQDRAQLMVGAGVFGFGVASEPRNAEFRIAYRFQNGLFGTDGVFRGFKPLIGAAVQTSGSQFGYLGLAAPFVFGADDRWEIVFEGGPGAYRQGSSSLDLGGTFEFHLGLAASYAVSDSGRLGVGVYHISNANTHAKNPGVNSVLATYTFSFDGL